jgi:RNA polymerase sigma-70 factor (ECF subfamily)
LRAYLRVAASSSADIDDLVQESYLRLLRARDRSPVRLDDAADVIDLVNRRQEQTLLAEAIRALPERCRHVLLLRKIHGLSQKEISAKLGISENTVESLVSRGLRRCAEQVRKHLPDRH